MSVMTELARLRATVTLGAEPIATVRHIHLEAEPFVLVPLTLAGEACAPLAMLAGCDSASPTLLTVHQPRNRADRFRFVEHLAGLLLPYLADLSAVTGSEATDPAEEEQCRALVAPQLIVPNGEGIGWLGRLGRLTRLRATEGPYAVSPDVVLLGKWLTWFKDRAEVPGTAVLTAMTRMLTEHWATGQSSAEDSHLASVLAWIEPPAGRTGAEAARATEAPALFPPAGPATDPVFDATTLQALMAGFDGATNDRARRGFAREMDRELTGQMLPTWQAVWHGVELLRRLPEGGHLARRRQRDCAAFSGYGAYLAEDGRPQGRRDQAVGAARRLAFLEEAEQLYEVERAFDDPLVMAEYELGGEAFTGVVVDRAPDRLDDSGARPRRRPTVTLRVPEPPKTPVGAVLRSPARRTQPAEVRSITAAGQGGFEVLLEITGGLGRGYRQPLPPGTVPELGEELTFTTLDPAQLPSRFPAAENTPWTHGGPPRPYEPTVDDAEEAWE